jgi:hypothetical protein
VFTRKRERVPRGRSPASVRGVEFSRELRDDHLAGDITLRRAGEADRATLRDGAAHAGPTDEDTLVHRIELDGVSPEE